MSASTAIEPPNSVQEVLASCPAAGKGVHNWLFVAALRLHRHCPNKDELAELLRKATADCGRDVPEEEIWNAINNSQPIADGTVASQGALPSGPRWPHRNEEKINAIVQNGPGLQDLQASSPMRCNDDQPHTEEIIDALFPGNPLLCAGPRKELAITRSREEWRGHMSKQQFLVPNPMVSVFGKTKGGRDGMRTLSNTGSRRFIVVEFDQGTFDQHAAVLVHLAKLAPLVLAVHSGNKSAHGWFYCGTQPEEKVERFFRNAVSLGADPATWTLCQYVRMPGGQRGSGARQRVLYFNPAALEGIK